MFLRPKSFWGRFFVTLALVVLVLAFLALVTVTFESWRGTRKWNQYKKQLEAQGEKLDLRASAPPAVPEEKNFACHPLVARMFVLTNIPNEDPHMRIPTATIADLAHEKAGYGPGYRKNDLRAPLKVWADYYRDHSFYPQAPTNASPAEVVKTALSIYDPQIGALMQAMRERPQCHYPLQYQDGPKMFLPHLGHIKGLTTVLKLRALADLHLGRSDKAFEELQLGFFLNDSVRTDQLLVNFLFTVSMDKILWEVIQEGIGLQVWKDSHLAWFVDYLARQNYLAIYQASMRTERNFGIYIMESLVQGELEKVLPEEEERVFGRALRWMPSGVFHHNLYYLVKMYQESILASVDLQRRMVEKDHVLNLENTLKNMGFSPYNIYARLLLPAMASAIVKAAHWQTLGDATMIACAAERYRLSSNQWPAKLENLVPRYMPFLPKDVVNDQPFVYKINGPDSILIYTFGWDEWDNKGVSETKIERGDWGVEIAPPSQTTKR